MMKTSSHDNSAVNVAVENNLNTNKGGEKDLRWCNNCKRLKHTREACWKVNKRPQQGNKTSQAETVPSLTSAANRPTSSDENLPFTKEQIDLLYKIMGKLEVTPTSTSCSFAKLDTPVEPLQPL